MIESVFAALIALIIGVLVAVAGLGGGFLYVPTLTLIFGLDQKVAIGTSLAVTICASAAATLYCAGQKKILYRASVFLIIPGMIGAITGSVMTGFIDNRILTLLFIVALLAIAFRMLVFPENSIPKIPFGPVLYLPTRGTEGTDRIVLPWLHLIVWGFFGGLVAGTTGISGGVLFVPALVSAGVPIHYAIATSLFAIILTSFAGAGIQAGLGNVSLPFLIVYGTGAAIGAYAGAAVAQKIPAGSIRIFFGCLIAVIATLVAFHAFL
jgi:uncharacterized protein